ncbi:MAG TPA: DUF4276 family protein [Pedobacter sp.]|uniref:DUF4276 family protein n=1 Tax=Pedobacter sp. TaxID=1411316 RepID=UPI002B7FC3FE|nr:DUF4276 family protein [Pedobacter sp.]HMI05741.1 DUF4276 family protein [Pedobacter sp.]
MKRIIIICEGQTEQEFCKDVLYPYLFARGILILHPLIKKSNGGIVSWYHLKKQIEGHLKEDTGALTTTFIDYYGTQEKHSFPKWAEGLAIPDKGDRLTFLEASMKADIDASVSHRFIPYIQLHEFEGLLFNDVEVFKQHIPVNELLDVAELNRIIYQNPNPELINDGHETAPSKRLKKLVLGYSKRIYGPILAEAIGLERIMEKCPRFKQWIVSFS